MPNLIEIRTSVSETKHEDEMERPPTVRSFCTMRANKPKVNLYSNSHHSLSFSNTISILFVFVSME
jgi:hypothetical protein